MATYKDLQDRIALDYLNRYDLMAEVRRAIQNSIKCYEAQRFWFNETATTTTTTANAASLGIPSDFLILDRLELTYSGSQLRLIEEPFDCIREMNATSSTGVPTHFAYRGDKFNLAVIPASAYSATCYYVHSLPTLSADTDSNAWTNEAQNLIAHSATLDLLSCVIKDTDTQKLERHGNLLGMALRELNLRNTTRLTTRLRATQF